MGVSEIEQRNAPLQPVVLQSVSLQLTQTGYSHAVDIQRSVLVSNWLVVADCSVDGEVSRLLGC